MIEVDLIRHYEDAYGTIGSVWVEGKFVCYTLENPWRNNAQYVSCIPAGVYRVVREYSNGFQSELYEFKDVPGRSECKFHAGNKPSDTKGCPLPGFDWRKHAEHGLWVADSMDALEALYQAVHSAPEFQCRVSYRKLGYWPN